MLPVGESLDSFLSLFSGDEVRWKAVMKSDQSRVLIPCGDEEGAKTILLEE